MAAGEGRWPARPKSEPYLAPCSLRPPRQTRRSGVLTKAAAPSPNMMGGGGLLGDRDGASNPTTATAASSELASAASGNEADLWDPSMLGDLERLTLNLTADDDIHINVDDGAARSSGVQLNQPVSTKTGPTSASPTLSASGQEPWVGGMRSLFMMPSDSEEQPASSSPPPSQPSRSSPTAALSTSAIAQSITSASDGGARSLLKGDASAFVPMAVRVAAAATASSSPATTTIVAGNRTSGSAMPTPSAAAPSHTMVRGGSSLPKSKGVFGEDVFVIGGGVHGVGGGGDDSAAARSAAPMDAPLFVQPGQTGSRVHLSAAGGSSPSAGAARSYLDMARPPPTHQQGRLRQHPQPQEPNHQTTFSQSPPSLHRRQFATPEQLGHQSAVNPATSSSSPTTTTASANHQMSTFVPIDTITPSHLVPPHVNRPVVSQLNNPSSSPATVHPATTTYQVTDMSVGGPEQPTTTPSALTTGHLLPTWGAPPAGPTAVPAARTAGGGAMGMMPSHPTLTIPTIAPHSAAMGGRGGGGGSHSHASGTLCHFYMQGNCRYGTFCRNIHGMICPKCGQAAIHPTSGEHLGTCHQLTEEEEESSNQDCMICMENTRKMGRKFGLLNGCNHVFCLTCIRNWRASIDRPREVVRACPICREVAFFIIPCDHVPSPERKEEIVAAYLRRLEGTPCRYFKFEEGSSSCPFGSSCFYAHLDPSGNQVVESTRKFVNAEGEVDIIKSVRLSDFIT